MSFLKDIKITNLVWFISIIAIIFLISIGYLGLSGIRSTIMLIDTIYKDRVVPMGDLKFISDMYDIEIYDSLLKYKQGKISSLQTRERINKAMEEIDQRFNAYLNTHLVEEEKKVVDELAPLIEKSKILKLS